MAFRFDLAMLSACTLTSVNLAAARCSAADYWGAYIGPDRGIYVDAASVRSLDPGDHRSLSQVTFSLGFPKIAGAKVAYVSNDKEIDCKGRRARDLSMTAFSEAGSVLLNTKREGGWQPIPAGQAEDRLIAVVCGSLPLASDPARFSEIKDARADYLVKSSIMQLGK
jgi:hypothetical protein